MLSIARAHLFKMCTGSLGSSHHPSSSPECELFGLFVRPPRVGVFFQFELSSRNAPEWFAAISESWDPDGWWMEG